MTDNHPEGNAQHPVWETEGVPGWQAALIRLARPALLWALGIVTMGLGALLVGIVEAIVPGRGIAMAKAMAALLRAYPGYLYLLVAFLFGGQALASVIKAWKGTA
ncbi:hypothetical protein [Stakelama tenebrarum]|uniref:Uncharacterized protein n=1 Tax=Stakelama tenebrarum TaxID=2711215 RepID=A0A6G6Y5Y9_9SPHN|nr:hypothetical protein [Sphingosinithalassobacter tenebrarum]QIG80003.1 hypothetical protein G5C33_09585 [Sphingosinithalassobacter tenebrarum]